MSPARRLEGVRVYGRAADAFETVAWRPPSARRFDGRVANDPTVEHQTLEDAIVRVPGWVVPMIGAAVAALLGLLLGGLLAV
ncbi:MAG: hypothetical protein ACK4VY_07900 [Brevundimonas sp.]